MAFKIPRNLLVSGVSVILRVPALFIAEIWYRTDIQTVQYGRLQEHQSEVEVLVRTVYYLALVFALILVLLPLKKLVHFYMYIVSTLLLALAHYLAFLYVEKEKSVDEVDSVFQDASSIQRLGINLVAQGIIGALIAYILEIRHWSKLMLLIYTAPMIARIANFPISDLHIVHNFSSVFTMLLVVFYIFNHLGNALDVLKTGVNALYLSIQLYGWVPCLMMLWFRILFPVQFLTFWLILFVTQMYIYFSAENHPIFGEGWLVVLLASIGESCVTPVSLIGLCITVSYISYLLLTLTKLYLQGWAAFMHDNVMHRGWTEGFTMFLLAVQTGLIELRSPQRAFLMSIVLFIVVSSLIQSMYEIADPILLALSASQNKSVVKHLKAVLLCSFLWMFPLFMTYTICQFFDLDFWLLVIVSSCLLTSVQVVGSLVVYGLFMYDALRHSPWENLDDIVYYAKATTRVLEFIVAVFVVCYGAKESIFGEWSWINSSILIIHCYFNVWQRLQAGWKSYLLRREAVQKIEALPEATAEQLAELNDLCAICFQELRTARVTPCHHFFHALCLKKWLYVQDTCPMCHKKINMDGQSETDQGPPGGDQANQGMEPFDLLAENLQGEEEEVPEEVEVVENEGLVNFSESYDAGASGDAEPAPTGSDVTPAPSPSGIVNESGRTLIATAHSAGHA